MNKEDKIAIGQRILKAMTLRGVTKTDVKNHLDIGWDTVNKWCKGISVPRIETLKKLSDFLGVNEYYILRGEGEDSTYIEINDKIISYPRSELYNDKDIVADENTSKWGSEKRAAIKQGKPKFLLPTDFSMVLIPVYSIASGEPRKISETGSVEGYAEDYIYVKRMGTDEHSFAIKISDDSMFPHLKPGDLAVVSPKTKLESGRLCFVMMNDGKRYVSRYKRYQDIIALVFDNIDENRYPDIVLSTVNSEDRFFRIIRTIRNE